MDELYQHCPRFKGCSINRCPLDSEYASKRFLEADREKSCGLPMETRLKIHNEHHGQLRFGGLTPWEYQVIDHWNALTDEQQALVLKTVKEPHN